MDRIFLTERQETKKEKNILFALKKEAPTFLMSAMGLFIGRLALFGFMNPVAIAFISLFMGRGYKLIAVAFFTAIGMLTRFNGIYILKYLSSIMLICAAEFFLGFFNIKLGEKIRAVPGAIGIALMGLLFSYIGKYNAYYIFMSFLEGILALALYFIILEGSSILEGKNKKLILGNESIISLAILLGAVLAGVSDIYILNISLKYLFASLLILLTAYKGGGALGSASGVLIGFILTLTGYANYSLVGILSIGGMIAGLMKDAGKLGSVIGFLCGGIITGFYLDISIFDKSLLLSVFLASIIFYVMPKNIRLSTNAIINEGASSILYADKSRELSVERLKGFSQSFKRLGDTFNLLYEKNYTLSQKDISSLIDDVAAKCCENCKFKEDCWEINFYSTYQMAFALLEIREKEGYLSLSNIPPDLQKFCVKMDSFSSAIGSYFELYKNNISWQNKIAESRQLVSSQLTGLSNIIDKLSDEMEYEFKFVTEAEEAILNELMKNNIDAGSVLVMENRASKYEISIDLKPCNGKRSCTRQIIPIINRVTGRKMKKEVAQCYAKNGSCMLRLIEEQKYQFINAVASSAKEGSLSSGDSHTTLELKNGRQLLALSDGMGSGKRAKAESEASISLTEELLESVFKKKTAYDMINSVLILKSDEDSFSTLDICLADGFDGSAQFVKIGAAPTFIIRGKTVMTVEASALPIGILKDIDVKISKRKLKDGDIIVMVTDGITEIKKGSLNKDWILNFLSDLKSSNPDFIAQSLIKEAIFLSDNKIKDDMTVIVSKVWVRP